MIRWTIYAGGKIKSPWDDVCKTYLKRLGSLVVLQEIEGKQWKRIIKLKSQIWVVLDHKGVQYSSQDLWKKLDTLMPHHLCFFIGESYGIPEYILDQSNEMWSFGLMTWPHIFARAMLLEQLYRKILAQTNHPYSCT
ncbi:ribosomal RNA large subunit methyltransferase H [Holospora obtusa F1]|uniref:Ribosomal RNA large subunit methyltransferase H n=1 Tax=Holospora obtusa F1 TaxID=1399147 RepID=W6TFE7_HOLOB|nr:23S rRNA (pseudouridine(1915)-N(3))-methyltransferase RlmH [Holospora obtusa]ETZ06725.1 ribosomal RNA large subunit methyltransferase H [Holospora obtusa F1]